MSKKTKQLNKKSTGHYTVKELIRVLKKCDPKSKVKYTTGGSVGFRGVNYVSGGGPYGQNFVVIGELSW